jgi:hypothetical protein
MNAQRLEDAGAWDAETWVFYIVTPLVVALVGPGRYALVQRPIPWD